MGSCEPTKTSSTVNATLGRRLFQSSRVARTGTTSRCGCAHHRRFAVRISQPNTRRCPGERRDPTGSHVPEVAIRSAAGRVKSLRCLDADLNTGISRESRRAIDRATEKESRGTGTVGRPIGVTAGSTAVSAGVMLGLLGVEMAPRTHAIFTRTMMPVALQTTTDRGRGTIRREALCPEGRRRVRPAAQVWNWQVVHGRVSVDHGLRAGIGDVAAAPSAASNSCRSRRAPACLPASGDTNHPAASVACATARSCSSIGHRCAATAGRCRAPRSGPSPCTAILAVDVSRRRFVASVARPPYDNQ